MILNGQSYGQRKLTKSLLGKCAPNFYCKCVPSFGVGIHPHFLCGAFKTSKIRKPFLWGVKSIKADSNDTTCLAVR